MCMLCAWVCVCVCVCACVCVCVYVNAFVRISYILQVSERTRSKAQNMFCNVTAVCWRYAIYVYMYTHTHIHIHTQHSLREHVIHTHRQAQTDTHTHTHTHTHVAFSKRSCSLAQNTFFARDTEWRREIRKNNVCVCVCMCVYVCVCVYYGASERVLLENILYYVVGILNQDARYTTGIYIYI